jgi:subtilisin family serine protease
LPSFVTGRVVDNIDREAAAATHNVTGVDRLHELGIFGKGVKIGVIDTGIAYNHTAVCTPPSLKEIRLTVGSSGAVSAKGPALPVVSILLAKVFFPYFTPRTTELIGLDRLSRWGCSA